MCGRYVSARTEPDLIGHYGISRVDVRERPAPSYNVAPTRQVYAVRAAGDGARVLVSARWGLVPGWAGDLSVGARMINARIETVDAKPAFRAALRSRRCLLPADGYYEWARDADGTRRPFLLHAADGAPLTFAGLYEVWHDPGRPAGDPAARVVTVAVVTRAATGTAATVHDRMPVLLDERDWAAWLDPQRTDPGAVLAALSTPAPVDLVARPVDAAVGDVRNDGPHLVSTVEPAPPAPTLF